MIKQITQADLQFIEHANKTLEAHLELVKTVTNETEGLLHTYLPILQDYSRHVLQLSKDFGESVANIYKSTRELELVTKNTQNMMSFIQAAHKLEEILTPSFIDKINRLTK